jgi:hypothetical protein
MNEEKSSLAVTQQKLLNGVAYESLPETSIAVSRTFEKQFFQKSSYNSAQNEAICDFNTGAKFVNPRRSYLAMKVRSTVAVKGANFGHGSACNLIRRVVITSRSGVELSRTEDYNILMAKCLRYGCPKDWLDKFGEIIGLNDDTTTLGQSDIQIPTGGKIFMIPLDKLSPFFEGDGKSLIPPPAAAGLRVQITFASDAQALVSDDVLQKYEIDDIYIVANLTTMVDSWQKLLNEESARDGLTYSYPEWHTTQSASSQTNTNIEVRKAVARAMSAFVISKQLPDLTTSDNMKSDAYQVNSYQYRLGSLYPTQQPITTGQEAYFQAQSMWDGGVLDCKRPNAVSYTQFSTSTAPVALTGTSDGDGIVAVSLERNDVALNGVLNIAGMPTNNSRVLGCDLEFTSATARTNYLFMKHLRVAKFFIDNAVLSE